MKQLGRNFIWNSVGNTAYNGLQWLITVMTARKAGLDTAGVLAYAMTVSLAFRTIATYGIRDFQASDHKNKYSSADYMGFRIITCFAALALCVLFLMLNGISGAQAEAVFLYMLFRVSEGFSDLFQGIMQKNDRLDRAGISLTVKAVITTAAFAAGFFSAGLITGLRLMSLSALAVTFLFELPYAGRISGEGIGVSMKRCRSLAGEAAALLIYLAEASVMFNAPQYILSVFYDKQSLGAYSAVFSLALIIRAAFQYMYTPFITELSKLNASDDPDGFRRIAVKLVSGFAVLSAAFSVIAAFLGVPVLRVVYGEEILQFKQLIIPAVAAVCVYSLTTFACTVEIIKRHLKILIISHTAGALVCISAVCLFIRLFGMNGASYGFMLASAVALSMVAASAVFGKRFD